MDNKSAKRATIILGVVMIIAIGSSAVLPLFTRNIQDPVAQPTEVPIPTFAPPITDFSAITFDQDYLHPSGLFSVAQPTGWTKGQETSNPDGAEITFNNTSILSVLQISLQVAAAPLQSMDELEAIYNSAALNQSWSNYRRIPETGLNYRETGRRREGNRLIMDFELQNQRRQIFVARQVAWYDSDWVYSVRVVTPDNQINLLRYLIDNLVPTYRPNRLFAGTPADWRAYFDAANNFVLRYPSAWTLTDSAPGRPASIAGGDVSLRVETQQVSAPLDEAGARRYVESSRPNVTLVSAQPVTRGTLSGFSVAYSFADADGNPNSGLALLLNGSDNRLYVANLRLAKAGVDLNSDTAQTEYSDAARVLQTFQVLEGVNVPLPTPTATVAPPPTAAPAVEAPAEATSEATVGAPAEATPEATPGS